MAVYRLSKMSAVFFLLPSLESLEICYHFFFLFDSLPLSLSISMIPATFQGGLLIFL